MSFYLGTPYEKGASDCYDALFVALTNATIYTEMTMVGALATVRTEVWKFFKPIEESYIEQGRYFVGAQYEGRKDLGNVQVGDGFKYRGRGFIQITGRSNYDMYGKKLGIDLLCFPEKMLDVETSATVLATYFKENSVDTACNTLNWRLVRQLVNGGSNGLDTFLNIVKQYLA